MATELAVASCDEVGDCSALVIASAMVPGCKRLSSGSKGIVEVVQEEENATKMRCGVGEFGRRELGRKWEVQNGECKMGTIGGQ
jgi:hypothetical protein